MLICPVVRCDFRLLTKRTQQTACFKALVEKIIAQIEKVD